jgi:hypothetical protein
MYQCALKSLLCIQKLSMLKAFHHTFTLMLFTFLHYTESCMLHIKTCPSNEIEFHHGTNLLLIMWLQANQLANHIPLYKAQNHTKLVLCAGCATLLL